MIEEANRNCRNCAHCHIVFTDNPRYDRCLRNAQYCDIVLKYPFELSSCTPNNLIHWAPKPPTLWEKFINLFS